MRSPGVINIDSILNIAGRLIKEFFDRVMPDAYTEKVCRPLPQGFSPRIDWTLCRDRHRKRKSSLKPYNQGMRGLMSLLSRRSGRPS